MNDGSCVHIAFINRRNNHFIASLIFIPEHYTRMRARTLSKEKVVQSLF